MSQQGYTGGRRHPAVLTAIVGGHAALLAALVLIKMDLPAKFDPGPMTVEHIPLPTPPEVPPPPDRKPVREARSISLVTTVRPVIQTPAPGPIISPVPTEPIQFIQAPPTEILPVVIPIPALPLPEPAVVPEPPAPRLRPVALTPRGNPGTWVTNDDYPSAALNSEEQGRTRFTLTVAADGRPSACAITGSSGSATLDQAACRLLMKRARFTPGKDADGQATGGTWTKSFLWQIPED